ncbi:MAG: LysR family transcriptional regulator [Candidatus Tectimicrobiota bacterium]|nr:MAG: LysR family transcriptional regulator [Candidatus Tectomicrobia bacterium]
MYIGGFAGKGNKKVDSAMDGHLRDLDLRQLEIFYYVAKCRSFSRAADLLLLTQPTVSGHIKALEDRLALVLFDRRGREVRLTRAGEVLYGYARRLLATKAAALQALQELQGGLRGELVLGGSSIPGQYLLPRLLGVFRQHYPDITVTLTITDTANVLERIVHGELEVGMVGAHLPHPQVVYWPVVDDELVLVVARHHPWAAQRRVPLAALAHQPFLQRERGSGSRLVVEQTLRQHGFDPAALRVVAEMGSTEAIKQGVKAGLGVAIVSRLALADELQAGTLQAVELAGVRMQRHFFLVRHRGRPLSPLSQTFIRFVEEREPWALLAAGQEEAPPRA